MVDLQAKLKRFTAENVEISAQLEIYKDTQNELTAELADFKEKYREILDLLHDAQDEIKELTRTQRSKYSGLGQHNVSSAMYSGGEDSNADADMDDLTDSTANLHSFDTNSGNFYSVFLSLLYLFAMHTCLYSFPRYTSPTRRLLMDFVLTATSSFFMLCNFTNLVKPFFENIS